VLAAVLLATLSVSPKIWIQRHAAQVDTDRLNRDIVRRLTANGFRTSIDRNLSVPAVRAWRAECRLLVRNGDRARELLEIFSQEGAGYGALAIGYRGSWSMRPAGARTVLERFAQNGMARVGVDFERPAVIALSQSGGCPGVRDALGGIAVRAFLKSARRATPAEEAW